jgi:protein required for attachment to host cells
MWVLVADSGRARVFSADSPIGELQEVQSFTNPEARLQEQELLSDRPGRSFDSAGEGRHAMGSTVEPKEQEAIRFAKQIGDYLEKGRIEFKFEHLVIVAAPKFLGLLRDNISPQVKDLITLTVDKNLVDLKPSELRARLSHRP